MPPLTLEEFRTALAAFSAFPEEQRERALAIGEKLNTDVKRGEFLMELSKIHDRFSEDQKDMEQALEEMKALVTAAEHTAKKIGRAEEEEASRSVELHTVEQHLTDLPQI